MSRHQMIWGVGEQRGPACCGVWPIERLEGDEVVEWHTAYANRDDASYMARDLNRAYREGFAAGRKGYVAQYAGNAKPLAVEKKRRRG